MRHQVVQIKRGKRTIKMIDDLRRCNRRLRELRSSYHGDRTISFVIEPAESTDRYEQKPAASGYQAGDYAKSPRRVR